MRAGRLRRLARRCAGSCKGNEVTPRIGPKHPMGSHAPGRASQRGALASLGIRRMGRGAPPRPLPDSRSEDGPAVRIRCLCGLSAPQGDGTTDESAPWDPNAATCEGNLVTDAGRPTSDATCALCGMRVLRGRNPETGNLIDFDARVLRLYSYDLDRGTAELVSDWPRKHGFGTRPAVPHASLCSRSS